MGGKWEGGDERGVSGVGGEWEGGEWEWSGVGGEWEGGQEGGEREEEERGRKGRACL